MFVVRILMFASPCLIYLFANAFQPVRAAKPSVSATFQPGKLGIGAAWSTGEVTRIDKGGQGDENGVQVGMFFHKIDGEAYSEALLDSKIGGNADYKLAFKAKKPPPKIKQKDDEDDPERPDFKYAVELDHTNFKEMVYKVTNGTKDTKERPPYYPVVMFHVSWCKHCRHSLPEIEKAAQMVDEAVKAGRYAQYMAAPPKFFVMECDLVPEHKPICDMHVQSNYPVIKLFRDNRAFHFNRPRIASTFAWWAGHVSRPPISQLSSKAEIKMLEENSPVFILSGDFAKHAEIIEEWKHVALDNVEDLRFAITAADSELSKALPAAPSVSVKGKGYEPIPLEVFGGLDREAIGQWVNFNQFKPLVELDAYSASPLKKSNIIVITLLYHGDKKIRSEGKSGQLLAQFESKARELRRDGQYFFAELDLTKEGNTDFIRYAYPLLDPTLSPPPCMFAFKGWDTYWESPSFTDPAMLSEESIQALLADSEALQDGSSLAWVKEQKKKYFRRSIASFGFTLGLVIAFTLPLLILACLWRCCKSLCASEDEMVAIPTKTEKAD